MATFLCWFRRNTFYFTWILLHLKYSYSLQQDQDFLDELLSSYKSRREHFKLRQNRRARDTCQPILLGNTTFETFTGENNSSKSTPVEIHTFVKRLSSEIGERFVYGHLAIISDPRRSLSVLEPLKPGSCQTKTRATVAESSKQMNCRVAVNAGFFNTHSGSCLGNIVTDGKLVRDAQGIQNANFGILKDGKLVTGYLSEQDVTSGNGKSDFLQLVTGVVWILRNGSLYINESIQAECGDTEETGTLQTFANVVSARTAVGHDKYGRVLIVQVDGKTNLRGLNLYEFGSLLKSFGLVNAINLDGGGSAIFVVNGTVISYPSDECDHYLCARKVTTILCVHDNLCKPTDCSGHGTCDADGHCVCDKPWTGPSCSQQDCNSIVCTASELYNATLPDLEWACHSNSSNCSRNETTKTLIKKFLLKNYAWLDALLGISLIVNFILLIILFCGNSTNQTIRRRPSFSRKDDEMRLLTSNNYDDDEI